MALFKTTEQLRSYYPARMTFAIEDLLPVLNEVEQEYLAEQVLGQNEYESLEAAYQDDAMDADQEALLAKCRPAIVGLALYRYTGEANVEFTSGGLAVTGGSNSDRAPASEWRTRDFEKKQLRSGMRGLDVLVNWLLENADTYNGYLASEQYAALIAGFTRTTQTFGKYVNIGNSGYLFSRMKQTIKRIEEGPVQDTLCSTALRDDLLTKLTEASLSADETTLVELVQKSTAHLAMADSIVELSLQMNEHGIFTVEGLLAGQTSIGPKSASDARLQQRIEHHRNVGNGYLKKLRDELQAQAEADSNHLYAASTCFVPTTTTPDPQFKTDGPVASFMG
jgi:hypothetical protein